LYEILKKANFKSNIDFCDRAVIPPESTIGYHQQGCNEDIYIVLEGEGLMTIEGNEVIVKKET